MIVYVHHDYVCNWKNDFPTNREKLGQFFKFYFVGNDTSQSSLLPNWAKTHRTLGLTLPQYAALPPPLLLLRDCFDKKKKNFSYLRLRLRPGKGVRSEVIRKRDQPIKH